MIFRQKAMLRTAIRPKRKVVAGRTLRNGVARRGYRGVPVDDFRASFPLSGMTLSVVLGRTPWRAVRESYTDCREYMPLPPFVSPRPAEDVPAGCRSSAPAGNAGSGKPFPRFRNRHSLRHAHGAYRSLLRPPRQERRIPIKKRTAAPRGLPSVFKTRSSDPVETRVLGQRRRDTNILRSLVVLQQGGHDSR